MTEYIKVPCDWCCGSSILNVGAGIFRDSDVDFSMYEYIGIPVCGGCGGTGYQIEDPEFKKNVHRIMELRFIYHPTDMLPVPPEIVRFKALSEIEKLVKQLVETYGDNETSFAHRIVAGQYSNAVEYLQEYSEAMVEAIKSHPNNPDIEVSRDAMLAYFSGDQEKGKELFLKAIEVNPQSGPLVHDLAGMLLIFHRSPADALPMFVKATELTPKALHDYHAAQCHYFLKQYPEALMFLEAAETKEDFLRMKDDITELKELIQQG